MTVYHVSGYPWSPEEGVKSHRAGVIGSCELLYVGAGNQIWVLWKKIAEVLNYCLIFSVLTYMS